MVEDQDIFELYIDWELNPCLINTAQSQIFQTRLTMLTTELSIPVLWNLYDSYYRT